ncbi:hypothetical protein [Streptomyces gobiensis]|uniref:hypothetical protein n=1 Tax=Streptomyces gobiensis TaxID=2875706 RepID=UPI001E28E011|nr:hypothetical protein [Streptomyces gobiensis]UGY93947.1 hypothetical protein test1122_20995 [Streptomyces gobiensis]
MPALPGRITDVDAVLGAEMHIRALTRQILRNRLNGFHRGLFERVRDGADQSFLQLIKDPPDNHPRHLRRGRTRDRGRAERHHRRRRSGDQLHRQNNQLDDDRYLAGDDNHRHRFQRERQQQRRRTRVIEVSTAIPGELLPLIREALHRLPEVLRDHIPRSLDTPLLQPLQIRRELPPRSRTLHELVLIRLRPVIAKHLQDPLKLTGQHHRHGRNPPKHAHLS